MNAARRIVRVICVFNGVCAVVCGGFMMAGAAGILPPAFGELFGFFDLMVPLIQRMPLPAYMTADLFWPGLALTPHSRSSFSSASFQIRHFLSSRPWLYAILTSSNQN